MHLLFGLAETVETLLKDCLKIGIDLNFEITGNISAGLHADNTTPHDKCTQLKRSNTGMYLCPYT